MVPVKMPRDRHSRNHRRRSLPGGTPPGRMRACSSSQTSDNNVLAESRGESAENTSNRESELSLMWLTEIEKIIRQCGDSQEDNKRCNIQISSNTGIEKHGSNAPSRASNLKRHLRNKHPDIFKSVQEHYSEIHKPTSTCSTSKSEQVPLTKYFHNEKITVTMTATKFKKHLIDLVVKNGVALTLFSSPAFIGLNGEMAAKQRVNYMAINVQFIDDERNLAIRTLAVRVTEAQHSSEYIKNLIENILIEYDISKQQILSIVTDNATNMTSAVQKLNVNDEEMEEDPFENIDEEFSESLNIDENETINNAVDDFIGTSNISHMRCAAHTLQLAIRDGLKEKNVANIIVKLRSVAVTARTLKIDAILKRRSGKGAILDQATRWGSTFEMIQRLLELRPYLTDMTNTNVTMTDIQVILSTSSLSEKSNLRDIAVRIKMLTDNDFKDISTSDSENDNDDSSSNSNGSNDFEKHLDNKDKSKRRRLIEETEQNRNRKVTPIAKFNQEFMEAFQNIAKIDRKSKLDVNSAISKYPKIVQDVASIVTALPPTQVSVEPNAIQHIPPEHREETRGQIVHLISSFHSRLHQNTLRPNHDIKTSLFIKQAHKETQQFLEQHPDLVITTADKAKSTIILTKTDYNDKINTLLNDKHK
ncbi:hypothetical protein CBL_02971 [Carabus blaptoides fortunei]